MSRLDRAAIVLGVGLAMFFDGIAFHQVLQWHHMLSSMPNPPVHQETADGLFHAAAWVVMVVGLALLWRARGDLWAIGSGRTMAGAILIGAGWFNLIEGVLAHLALGIHHVRTDTGNALLWDLGFLAAAVVLIGIGWGMKRSGGRRRVEPVSFPPRDRAGLGM